MKKNKDKSIWNKINFITQFVKKATYARRIFWFSAGAIYLMVIGIISFFSVNLLHSSFTTSSFNKEKFMPLEFGEILIDCSKITMKESDDSLRMEYITDTLSDMAKKAIDENILYKVLKVDFTRFKIERIYTNPKLTDPLNIDDIQLNIIGMPLYISISVDGKLNPKPVMVNLNIVNTENFLYNFFIFKNLVTKDGLKADQISEVYESSETSENIRHKVELNFARFLNLNKNEFGTSFLKSVEIKLLKGRLENSITLYKEPNSLLYQRLYKKIVDFKSYEIKPRQPKDVGPSVFYIGVISKNIYKQGLNLHEREELTKMIAEMNLASFLKHHNTYNKIQFLPFSLKSTFIWKGTDSS